MSTQCDIIASDDSTTCHILCLRSVSVNADKLPFCSLTHIDKPEYEKCIRDMIREHKTHHFQNQITMDVHIMGGYNDPDGFSREISEFLLRLLGKIAYEERYCVIFHLQTCLISCLNDSKHQFPIGRGLCLELSSGRVFLSRVHSSAETVGPQFELRNSRVYSSPPPILSLVHTARDPDQCVILIEPFFFEPDYEEFIFLVEMPDSLLLQYTSTSPEAEKEDFCVVTRRIFKYIINTPWQEVFGKNCDRTLRFKYCSTQNTWIQI